MAWVLWLSGTVNPGRRRKDHTPPSPVIRGAERGNLHVGMLLVPTPSRRTEPPPGQVPASLTHPTGTAGQWGQHPLPVPGSGSPVLAVPRHTEAAR